MIVGLVSAVQQAEVCGVGRRRVDQLVESLGLRISLSEVRRISRQGRREIIGLDVGAAETEAFWIGFLRSLVARGLVGVQLAISDDRAGGRDRSGP